MAKRNNMQLVEFITINDKRFLPCPFCGTKEDDEGHSFHVLQDWWYKIRCTTCEACPYSSESKTLDAAIDFWNKRVQLSSLDDAKFLIKKVINDLTKVIE